MVKIVGNSADKNSNDLYQSLILEITNLTDDWYNLICDGNEKYPKDRDCNWYIRIEWSCGLKPIYIVEHQGKILSEFYVQCETYESALLTLKKLLKTAIQKYKETKNYKTICRF